MRSGNDARITLRGPRSNVTSEMELAMMSPRRITLTLETAVGGLLAAFVPTAVAYADDFTFQPDPITAETVTGINGDPPFSKTFRVFCFSMFWTQRPAAKTRPDSSKQTRPTLRLRPDSATSKT